MRIPRSAEDGQLLYKCQNRLCADADKGNYEIDNHSESCNERHQRRQKQVTVF
jgi:hypothetical protein